MTSAGVVAETDSDMQSSAAIQTRGLTKKYGSRKVVDNLDIEVRPGEIFGFLGPNGAGKSTTMRMLLGLVRPAAGSSSMLGLDVGTQLPTILERTGAIIENPTFYPFLNGRDNLRIVARLRNVSDDRISRVLEVVDLTADADRKFKTYSLGMKQRLAVAGALLTNPVLLILDEPANGLDPSGIVEMRKLMVSLRDEGKSVFISSHVLHEIEQICDRIAILNRGKVVAQGAVDALLRGTNQILVKVAPLEKARSLLEQLDFVTAVTEEAGYLVVNAPGERGSDINRTLASAGLYASEIRAREESLEQYFLEVTQAAES